MSPRRGPLRAGARPESDQARSAIALLEAVEIELGRAACVSDTCTFARDPRHDRKPDGYCAPCLALHLVRKALAALTTWRRSALVAESEELRLRIKARLP